MTSFAVSTIFLGLFLAIVGNAWGQTNVFPASGNTGIGTTSPAEPLDVKTGTNQHEGFFQNGGYASVGAFTDSFAAWAPLSINAGANTFIGIGAGDVGIGTTTPAGKLEVNGDVLADYGATFGYTSNVGVNNGLILGTVSKSVSPSGGQGTIQISSNDASNQFQGMISLVTDPNGSNRRLAIQAIEQNVAYRPVTLNENGGYVGIGTANPAYALQIVGEAGQDIPLYVQSQTHNSYIWFANIGGSNSISASDNNLYIGGGGVAGYIYFRTGWNTGITLTPSGDVGIGTTNPTYPLSVNGTIQAKEVIVNTGWSDYVFGPHFHLQPLAQVASYITTHHHLPGIPTAREVEAKGVSVGNMQAKLLAKVEELTLRLIAQDKRLRSQNQRLEIQAHQLLDQGSQIAVLNSKIGQLANRK